MKFTPFVAALAAFPSLILSVQAQILVGPSGSGIIAFGARPPAAEWSTRSITGGESSFIAPAALDAAVATNVAGGITTQLLNGGAGNPPAANGLAQWTSGGTAYALTIPTAVGAALLMATLRNDTGADANTLQISYTHIQSGPALVEQVPAYQVYYSLTGAANSWALIPELSGGTAGARDHTLYLAGNWAASGLLYLLWADDNTPNGTDQAQGIDGISFIANNVAVPLSVTLTAPPNGQLIVAPDNVTNVTLSAISGGTVPATSVSFYTNGALAVTVTSPPFIAQLTDLPAGIYSIDALADNGSELAVSATSTIKIRPQFMNYTGGTHLEDFSSMGTAGKETPIGWYVGSDVSATTPAPGVNATVGDGSVPPDQSLFAWNYGLSGDANRSLGTAPSAADRNTVLRLRNQTSSNLLAFEILFDAEVWRPNTNIIETLTNFVSFNRGTNWVATGFNFTSPVAAVNPTMAIDGHAPANRIAGIGGTITPPNPIPPGGFVYIRWLNINEANTDGALAIDNFSFRGTAFSDASAISLSVVSPTNGQTFPGTCAAGASITVNANAGPFVTNVSFQLDGGAAINDPAAPYSTVLSGVTAGPHTITASARDSFGVISNVVVTVSVLANQPPLVSFTNIFSGSNTGHVFLVGTPITNQFSVAESDGTLATVEFLVNDRVHFATNIAFGQLVVNNALAGASTFTVRATDNCGAVSQQSVLITITNPPVTTTSVIVSNGSAWKYFAAASAPPVLDSNPWQGTFYDDSLWNTGFAELGGGDAVSPPGANPERTLIDIGPSASRYRAVYFRHVFTVPDPSLYTGLIIRSLHDDGSAVYLNGQLVAAFNMNNTAGVPIIYNDLAASNVGHDGTVYVVSNITAVLDPVINCLAVEVHQDAVGSTDLSFDLMLWGAVPAGPVLTITTDGFSYTVTWDDPNFAYQLQQSTDIGSAANWTDVPGDPLSPYQQPLPVGAGHNFFRLKKLP